MLTSAPICPKMSFLAKVTTESLQLENVTVTSSTSADGATSYEYHLPHSRTLDLIGEEFAPRGNNASKLTSSNDPMPNVVVVSALPAGCTATGSFLNTSMGPVLISSASAADQDLVANSPQTLGDGVGGAAAIPLSTIIDLPSFTGGDDGGGVLLCNLDELSRYIPDNFFNDNLLDTNNLEVTTTPMSKLCSSAASSLSTMTTTTLHPSSATQFLTVPVSSSGGGPITIALPTQPEPLQAVKSFAASKSQQLGSFQPVKLTTTGYAITPSGERIAIQGLGPSVKPSQTLQVLRTSATGQTTSLPQTIQLSSLNFDPSRLTFMELPDGTGKFLFAEHKDDDVEEEVDYSTANTVSLALARLTPTVTPTDLSKKSSVTTVCSSSSSSSTTTIVWPKDGTTTANLLPRNIIFAGSTLPPGAIPIQINGLSALNTVPLSAVKSIPLTTSTADATTTTVLTTAMLPTKPYPLHQLQQQQQVITAKKTKVELVRTVAAPSNTSSTVTIVSKMGGGGGSNNNNNNGAKSGGGPAPGHVVSPNGKTCTWQFENGEMCGKTFSKSYNLVVHMRMHEDVRPFKCALCDQTFRQKAHLQRHETTHGIGTKVSRRSTTGGTTPRAAPAPPQPSASLQQRLARVSLQFGKAADDEDDVNEEDVDEAEVAAQHADLYETAGEDAGDKEDLEEEEHKVMDDSDVANVVIVGQILEFKDEDAVAVTYAEEEEEDVGEEDHDEEVVAAKRRRLSDEDGEDRVNGSSESVHVTAYTEVSYDLVNGHSHHHHEVEEGDLGLVSADDDADSAHAVETDPGK